MADAQPDERQRHHGVVNPVTATFNSTGMAVGTYTAYACIASNDPTNPLVVIPVTMEVPDPNCNPTQLFQDTGFEATLSDFTNPYWDNSSTKGGTALCNASCGANGAHSGAFWAWLGGFGIANPETSTVSQSVVIPNQTLPRYVNFWLRRTASTGDASLAVNVDGTTIGTFPKVATSETAYVQRSVQVPDTYKDGTSHTIELKFTNTTGSMGSMHVDDVTLGCSAPSAAATVSAPILMGDAVRSIH
jgi:hypothetical protein